MLHKVILSILKGKVYNCFINSNYIGDRHKIKSHLIFYNKNSSKKYKYK